MKNFHRFQNFQFSVIFQFVFANSIEQATHVTLFRIFREIRKKSSKILRKNANFDTKNENIQKFIIHSRQNVDEFWLIFLDLTVATAKTNRNRSDS